jgi:ABC-type multidrug transport system fused ATPase/permease subunit
LLGTALSEQSESKGRQPPAGIVFDHVWFAYSGEEYVLKDVSFHVEPGQRIGVVGATGAGKSTVINLLMRFYDVSRGRILVDGVDIREMDLGDLRARFSLVLQDVQLFSGTIASNIRLGSTATDGDVRRAAEAVHAAGFIDRLPKGLASEVASAERVCRSARSSCSRSRGRWRSTRGCSCSTRRRRAWTRTRSC